MLSKKTIIGGRVIKIIDLLKADLDREFSIREVSIKGGLSYDNCYRAIFDLSGRGIIDIKRKGKINYCSLRKSPETILLLAYTSFLETEEFLTRKIILRRILRSLRKG